MFRLRCFLASLSKQTLNKSHLEILPASRCLSTGYTRQIEELQIPISNGKVAAKTWGSKGSPPVLMLHGWLDNCGTFDKLLPLLSENFYYVAIDKPGHGRSSHKPSGCLYSEITMMADFKKVVESLGWEKFHMIGHSLGGAFSILFSCFFPDIVQKVVSIDTHKPLSCAPEHVYHIKRKGIIDYMKCEEKILQSPPVYSMDKAITRLTQGMHNEVNADGIEILLKRGSQPSECGKGVIFSRDLRCRPIELLSMKSHDDVRSFVSQMKSELLVISANNTHPEYTSDPPEVVAEILEFYKKILKKFVYEIVEGNHFVHLNNPETVAPIINKFLANE